MRTGEILRLMYIDIDFDRKVIHVRRFISEEKVTTPKTKSSIRQVPILGDLLPYMTKSTNSLLMFSRQDGTRLDRFGENRYRNGISS